MGKAILEITDGTSVNTIDLLGKRFGYILCDWRPARPDMEYATNKNWFSGTETPAQVIVKPTIDTFTFNARDIDVDTLIADEQKLSHLLHLASLYWTGNRAVVKPFYIKARSKDETGIRYAAIFSSQLHDDSNPYAQPFFSRNPASTDLIVPITHGEWLDYPPGTGGLDMHENVISTIESGITFTSEGIHFLNDDSPIPLVNMLSHVVLTHIFYGTDTSDNLMNRMEDVGYPLFSETDFANRYTYFGTETIVSRWLINGFQGIHFNITTSASPIVKCKWEIFIEDSAGVKKWKEVEVYDSTDEFTKPGSIIFNLKDVYGPGRFGITWAERAIGNVTGYWVRMSPKVPAITVIPAVSIKHPATIGLPYFDVLLASDEEHQLLNPGGTKNDAILRSVRFNNNIFPRFHISDARKDMRISSSDDNAAVADRDFRWQIRVCQDNYDLTGYSHLIRAVEDCGIQGTVTVSDPITSNEKTVYISTYWFSISKTWQVILDFDISKTTVLVGEEITFDPSKSSINIPSSDAVQQSTWTFGDGSTTNITTISPTIPTVKHTYTKAGEYDVSVGILCTSGMHSVITRRIGVIVKEVPIVASFTALHRRGLAPHIPMFDASSSIGPNLSYEWWFGDGTTGVGVRPTKTYTKRGIYSVKLKITEASGGSDSIILSGYIYVDDKRLFSGDEGSFLEFSFSPVRYDWDERPSYMFNRMYIGARPLITKYDHLFQGFIPVYGDTNRYIHTSEPSLVYWGTSKGRVNIIEDNTAYTGYVIENTRSSTVLPDDISELATLYFNFPSYDIYRGTYKLFIRVSAPNSVQRHKIYFTAAVSGGDLRTYDQGKYVTDMLHPDFITTIDLGSVVLGGSSSSVSYGVEQAIYIGWKTAPAVGAGQKIHLYDAVLIPQDTWYAEIDCDRRRFFEYNENDLLVGSITANGNVEAKVISSRMNELGIEDVRYVPSIIPGMPLSLIGADTRFTVLTTHYDGYRPENVIANAPGMYSRFNYFYELATAKKVNRYFSSRGKN